jgi:hypothetical protein
LLGPDATPVPGAAATLTRSINTPIPTPVRTASVVPSPSARVAVAASPGASPSAVGAGVSQSDVADIRTRIQQMLGSPDLAGIDALLLDHIALSTPQGGSIMTTDEARTWLRDHAGPNITVTQVTEGRQDVMLQVMTDGWPQKDPIQSGQVNFSLRRYDANGRLDDSGGGDWKIDVIDAE